MQRVVHSGVGLRVQQLLNPLAMLRELWRNRALTIQMAGREIAGRYRASMLGMLWAVVTPLILLALYTFVFSVVLKSRWGTSATEAPGDFAITMFCGMLVFNVFSEVLNRSPFLVVSNQNLVKKVVFPLEVLVPATLLAALFTLAVGLLVWLGGWFFVTKQLPPLTFLWLPVVLLPVVLVSLGIGWVLAALGVFLRDIGHVMNLVTNVLFFTTPIFFRLENVKAEPFRTIIQLNPLTHAVEDARRVMMGDYYWSLLGVAAASPHPDWVTWTPTFIASLAIAVCGYAFFAKSKRAFSDVL